MWSCSLLIMHTLYASFHVILFGISMKLPHWICFVKCSCVHVGLPLVGCCVCSEKWWRDLLGWLKNLLLILYAENPIHSWREGVAHNNWVVCSSSLGRLLTGTWQQWNINKFPVVGWQAGRCGFPRYHTSTARLRQTRSEIVHCKK